MTDSAPPRAERRLKGMLLRIVASFGFATMSAIGKLASEQGVGAIELVFYRSVFALPVVLLWVLIGPGLAALGTKRPLAHLRRAAIGITGMTLMFQALIMLPLAEAATISFAAPLFATLLAALLLSEKIARHRAAATFIGFIGILIVMQPGGHDMPLLGFGTALLGALTAALVTITLRQLGNTETASAIAFWFMANGALVMGAAMIFTGAMTPTPHLWLLFVLMGTAGGIAQLCMTESLQLAPVSLLAPFDYLQLLGAIFFGWLLWSDAPSWTTIAGGSLIVCTGIYTIHCERRRHVDRPPATPAL